MTMHGIRLFPMGLMVVLAATLNAQTKPVSAVAPAGAKAGAVSKPAPQTVAPAEAAPAPVAVADAAPAPELPKRPAELPPKPPKVTCKGEQLTISADNSTLDAILLGVRGCTGARIDLPSDASRIRSFEELGPGPVREVLDQLLSGTPYNYVIQSSEANPLKVEQVLLSMRTDDGKGGVGGGGSTISTDIPMTAGRRAWQKMQKFDKPDPSTLNADGTQVEADIESPSDEATPGSAAQAADASAAPAAGSPADSPAVQAATAVPAAGLKPVAAPILDPNSSGDPSKAVQDRIAAMQQMFAQRQQMMQKQNQQQGGAPNN